MEEKVVIKVDGDLKDFDKKAKKAIGDVQKSGKKIEIGKSFSQAIEKLKKPIKELHRGFASQMTGGMAHRSRRGQAFSKNLGFDASHLNEFQGGGFQESLYKRAAAIKDFKDRAKEIRNIWKGKHISTGVTGAGIPGMPDDKTGLGAGTGGGLGGGMGGGGGIHGTINVTATNVNIGGGKAGAGVVGAAVQAVTHSGAGASLGLPSRVQRPDMGQGMTKMDEKKGSMMNKLGQTLGIFGGVVMQGVGMLLNITSSVGERYAQAIGKQTGTWGATGGYVGSKQGYFANAELAQANIARGRITGESIYKKGNLNAGLMKYAASQGIGLSEMATTAAKLKETGGFDLGRYRKMAAKSGFTNLKESEFMQQVADYAFQQRSAGFSNKAAPGFAEFASSMSLKGGGNISPEARMGTAQKLDTMGRQGIFGGGTFGALGFVNALEASGGDVGKAISAMETDPSQFMKKGIGMLPEGLVRGIVGKQAGMAYNVMSGLEFQNQDVGVGAIQAVSHPLVAMENRADTQFAKSKAAKTAFGVAEKMQMDQLKMMEKLSGTIETTANVVMKIEEKLADVMNELAGGLNKTVETMTKVVKEVDEAGGIAEWLKKQIKMPWQ